MKACSASGILLLFLLAAIPAFGKDTTRATVVYDDRATEINAAPFVEAGSPELWLSTADLTRATGFAVKPQGVCRDELCFPLPKARAQEFLRPEDGTKKDANIDGKHAWFNLTAFAALVRQSVAHDAALSTWYFGLRSDQQQLASLRAPNFTLPDMAGRMHSLSDFRGKKVFLVTWASW